MEIILTHLNADFDALAAMVAAKKLYPRAKLVFGGSQNKNVRDFIALHQDLFDFLDTRLLEKETVKRLIVVDTRIADRLGELEDLVYQPGIEIFAFDHHPATPKDMKFSRDFSEIAGATTTILVKILRKKRVKLFPIEATLFALGIHEDTGSLTYPTTTPADAQTLTYLLDQEANLEVISQFLNYPLNREQHQLLEKLLKTANLIDINGLKVMLAQVEVPDYVDSASLLTHKLRDLENVDVIFTLLKAEDRIHIIGRSRVDQVGVGEILSKFGGGGHPQAASAVTKGNTLQKLQEELVQEIRLRSKSTRTAQEIMSKPGPTVNISAPVREAEKIMARFGEKHLPVLEGGKVVGFISHREVEKAAHYNLSHAPVKGFMIPRVVTIPPDTPLYQMQQLLVDKDIEKLPVTANGKMMGIVSRLDVLRAVHGDNYLPRKDFPGRLTPSEVREKLRFLPKEVRSLLEELGKIAEEKGVTAYLVGGIVRDILLGLPNLDLDIVVEGDGIAYGEMVAKELGGKMVSHRQFGTVVVSLPHFRVDIASARTEYYPKPAALPEVELAPVKKDLSRRDFTINAMALALSPPHFGEILDFFGGKEDIRKKRIRVLHPKSFVEDPTRIFRAVRFERRYGFKIEPVTEKWAREAVEKGLLERLSSVRLRDEFILTLSENKTWDILRRLSDLKILPLLHPKLKVTPELKKTFRRIEDSFSQLDYYFASKPRKWLVFLMALLRDLSEEEIDNWSREMKLRKRDAIRLKQGVLDSTKLLKNLVSPRKLNPSELYFLLEEVSPESLIFIFAQSASKKDQKKVEFYLTHLKGVKTALNGADLLKCGLNSSPAIGVILRNLLRAKLDGNLKTREDELKFVQEKIGLLDKAKSLRNRERNN